MLSNTRGYTRYVRANGLHRDDLSALRTVCPALRSTGKCKSHLKEQDLRRTIAAAKEAELAKKAAALYTAQMDLVADLGEEDGDAELLESLTSRAGFSTDPAKKAEMLEKLIAELKQEPAYLNWSLDAEVAARMVELRVKPCRFTHRGELTTSLKRSRGEQAKAEMQLSKQHAQEQHDVLKTTNAVEETENTPLAKPMSAAAVAAAVAVASSSTSSPLPPPGAVRLSRKQTPQERAWEEERHRIFQTLTPLQRCVVCLLWQRTHTVAHGVVCDVRLLLERRLTDVYDRKGHVAVDGVVVAAAAPKSAKLGKSGHHDAKEDEEDPLDAYLSSADFEKLVERESKRLVVRTAFRPEFGMVDLSALPLLVAHLSTTPGCGVILARTLTYFTGKALGPRHDAAAMGSKGKEVEEEEDNRPAPTSFHYLLFPTRRAMTEKEMDLGGTARADEVVEAIEWSLRIFQREAQLHGGRSRSNNGVAGASTPTASAHVSALFRNERVRLHGLTMTQCKITSADALVGALHKRHLEDFLYALDLSENRLWSLRFLLVLRAHFAQRLLRLSLKNNPITRKPEYQEQVRLSLPQLTSLDGEPIRRPPLRLPKPLPSSCTRLSRAASAQHPQGQSQAEEEEAEEVQSAVLDCVARLLYIWEARRIPLTVREVEALATPSSEGHFATVVSATQPASPPAPTRTMPEEEEWNEDNFPHRYLHPAATFSVALAPGMNFFDAAAMRDARSVESEVDFAGMRLSAVDLRDARVFDVAMKNSSRNLLAGRPALQRFGKGAENCYQAYQLTVYPERMTVEHHVTDAVIAVARVEGGMAVPVATPQQPQQQSAHSKKSKASKAKAVPAPAPVPAAAVRFGSLGRHPTPTQHVVTLHGVMTWHLPSMKAGECMRACYTRVMIFVKKVLPAQNREWERLRSPPYVLMNDELFLYPTPSPSAGLVSGSGGESGGDGAAAAAAAPCAIFRANTPARLSRLVVEFGLEACKDGVALVRDVMERCTSPAAEYAALQALVLGLLGAKPMERNGGGSAQAPSNGSVSAATLDGEDEATVHLARAAETKLLPVMESYVRRAACGNAKTGSVTARTYTVFSVLEGATTEANAALRVAGIETQSTASPATQARSSHPPQPAAKKTKKERQDTAIASEDERSDVRMEAELSAVQAWASGLHTVTLDLVHAVTAITNACYTSL